MEEGPQAQEAGARSAQGGGEGSDSKLVDVPFAIEQIDHVTITAPSELEAEVLRWYREVLGLDEIDKPEGTRSQGAWFRAGSQQLHVTRDEHNPPKTAHFGIVVDDFGRAVEHLRAAGCHMEQAREIPGRRRCFTRDPAGNGIEIMCFDSEQE